MKVCSCCNRPLADGFKVGGKIRQRVFDFVADNPDGVTTLQIMDAIYSDDPNGGPDDPKVINVVVNHINKRIASNGYRIKSSRGPGATYSLIKLDEAAA